MEFYIGKDKYNYSDEQLSIQLLNHGDEADVYRIKGKAVKIYKPYCPKRRLREDTVELFKNIDTKRLLLPKETVYDSNHKFNGYTTMLVSEGCKSRIATMKMTTMLDEMKLMTEDTKKLSSLGITIYDLRYTDVLYGNGNGIYYCDPGSYLKEKDMTEKEVEEFNKEELHNLIIEEILGPICKLTKKQKNKLREMILSGDYLSDIFSYGDFTEKESTSHFVKRITR